MLDDVFHDAYAAALARAEPASDAEVSLDHVAGIGTPQSLLSMYRHDDLVPLVTRFGIADRFARIDGRSVSYTTVVRTRADNSEPRATRSPRR